MDETDFCHRLRGDAVTGKLKIRPIDLFLGKSWRVGVTNRPKPKVGALRCRVSGTRRELPLATLERELRAAARGKKVKVLGV